MYETKKARTSSSKAQLADSSGEDAPLAKKLRKEKVDLEIKAEKEAKKLRASDSKKRASNQIKADSDDDDVPLAKKPKAAKAVKKEADTKPSKSTPKSKANGKNAIKPEQTEQDAEAEEEEEGYKWWEDPGKSDDSKKWDTLEHNGVVFPPPYERLPSSVKMNYDGVPVTLSIEAEEVAGFYGAMLNSTHNVENPTFNKNFFEDFKEILDRTDHAKGPKGEKIKITKFEKCNFQPIFNYYDAEREKKKAIPTADKKALKAKKDAEEAPYTHCKWDGRKQKVGNFRVEPPGLFRGRGEHPKTGKVKQRVQPEQVTINIGREATVPAPPKGHKWKEIKHDDSTTWLAMWQENINLNYKYVMLAANSDVKGQSDFKKFEKARELKKHIDRIRKDYQRDLKVELMADRQRAVAIYFIDQFALRAGNEKGEEEADTVGCCSLKYEHITLRAPDIVDLDFLGKDSIRFHNEVKVDAQVFKNLVIFKKNKSDGDEIFDRLSTSLLNKHLSSYMQGLTAKVFRTYNASWTFASLMKKIKAGGTVMEKFKEYNEVNRQVAILCNHKRTVAASHEDQVGKMQDRIDGVRYQQHRCRQMMLALEPKLKKQRGAAFFELPEGLTKEWVTEHHEALVAQEKQKITKKFEKENEKLVAEGSKEMKQGELHERLEAATELKKKLAAELKSGKVEPEGKSVSVDKLEEKIKKDDARVHNMSTQMEDKEGNKEVSLGTSKIVSF